MNTRERLLSFGQDEKKNPSSQTAFKEGVKLNFSFGTNKLLCLSAALNWSNKHLIGQTTKPPVQSLSMIYYTQFDQVSVLQQHLSSFIPKVKKKLESSLTCCLHLLAQLSRIAVPVDDILRLVCSGAPIHLLSGFRRSTRFCQAHLASASISVGHYSNEITPIKCNKGGQTLSTYCYDG